MSDCKCPKCGYGFTTEHQIIGITDTHVIKCKNGHFIGVINDMSKIKENIEEIAKHLGIIPRS